MKDGLSRRIWRLLSLVDDQSPVELAGKTASRSRPDEMTLQCTAGGKPGGAHHVYLNLFPDVANLYRPRVAEEISGEERQFTDSATGSHTWNRVSPGVELT